MAARSAVSEMRGAAGARRIDGGRERRAEKRWGREQSP